MSNLPPLPLIDGCLFVDNSMLELFTTCPRALQYSKLHARISASDSPSLSFGSAIHMAMELRYKTCANQPTDPFFNQDITQLLTSFFAQHPVPMEEYRNLNWALEVVRRYNDKYVTEDFNLLQYEQPQTCSHCQGKGLVQLSNETESAKESECPFCKGTGKNDVMVELAFALPLCKVSLTTGRAAFWDGKRESLVPDEIGIFYSGRIDLPFSRDGSIFVMDHKTTSVLGPTFFDNMKMSAQQKGYCWAFEQLTGQKVRGYEVNTIRVKEPPQYVKNGKESKYSGKTMTPEAWWNESLQRERFLLNDGELAEWKDNCISLVEEFFWHYSRGYFPKKTSWCVGKYGRCPYFEVCSLFPVEDRGVMLQSGLFTDNKWSPLIQPSQRKQ